MKMANVCELTEQELKKQLEDSRRELLNLRIQQKTGQLENSARIRLLRRDVARFLTETQARAVRGNRISG